MAKGEGVNFFGTIIPWKEVRRHIAVMTGIGALLVLAGIANADTLLPKE